MILIAVVVGYILGIAPLFVYKLLENKDKKIQENFNSRLIKEQEEIFDEYLNGVKNKSGVTQEDIIQEYLTGEVKKGE